MDEKPWQELTRLISDYQAADESDPTRAEAWNLIADFTVEHWLAIVGALEYVALNAPTVNG